MSEAASPDASSRGYLAREPDPLRYAASQRVAWEVTGMLCDLIPRGSRVLDVGCGSGALTGLFATDRDCEVTGVEPDPSRVAVARGAGLTVLPGFLEDQDPDVLGGFDVVVFADVLEHITDTVSALETAHRFLAPGGLVAASIPNVAHWSVRWNLARGRFDYTADGIMDATHVRWFTSRTVRSVFDAAGFEVVHLDWTSGSWLPPYTKLPGYGRLQGPFHRLLRRLVRLTPSLFGVQHIVLARPAPRRT